MDLFNLAARLTLDSDQFDKGLSGAEKSGKGLASSLEGTFGKIKKLAAGALSVAAIKKGVDAVLDLANATAEYGDRIDKQSQVLGMSRKAYQEWDYILGQNGASIDSMASSMKTLNSLVLNAAEGSGEAKDTFAQLGLSIHEIEQLNPEDQFEAVVRAFQKMPAGAQKSALAVKIFGKNGMELLPLLNQSATSIDELRAKAEEMGIIMSDDAVDASVAYGDAMDDLTRTFNGLKYSVGAKLLPALTQGVQKITGFAGKISKAFQENGLQGVWDTLVEEFRNIKWPSWAEVGNAISRGWNTIVENVKKLPGLVFGTKADGSVDWPDWDTVKSKAEEIWGTIKEKAVAIAEEFGALVFGKKADGSVDWPDWDTVQAKAKDIWEGIKNGALEIADSAGALIFGRKEDGSINFPSFTKIKADAMYLWLRVKRFVLELPEKLGGLIFGRSEDGSVAWPDISKVLEDFNTWWTDTARPALEGALVWTLKLFGMPTESAEQLASAVGEWWNGVVNTVQSVIKWALNMPSAPNDAGQELHKIIRGWWLSVKESAQKVLNWALGLFSIGDSDGTDTKNLIKGWWDNYIKPFLGGILDFTLGLFGLPSASDMANKIKSWWEQVKKDVGQLLLNATVNPFLNLFGSESGIVVPGSYSDVDGPVNPAFSNGGGAGSHGFAKGLNYVPFDGFPALLHRGEQIITASQARRNRANSGSLNTDAIASAVAGAIRSAMQGVSVNSYLNGQDITSSVDRDMARKLKARRFAT